MRYLTLVVFVSLISGCSFWPFGKEDTGSCLDDDSCDTPSAFEQQVIQGTWHCYGVSRNDGWDCSQEEDSAKIVVIEDETMVAEAVVEQMPARAEMTFQSEMITHQNETAKAEPVDVATSDAVATTAPDGNSKDSIFDYSDKAWAVQLIALQTEEEVRAFTSTHELAAPNAVRIRSQGSDWYVLLLGVFDSRADADAAAEQWTESQQPYSKPWVRPLGPLKQAVLEAQPAGD